MAQVLPILFNTNFIAGLKKDKYDYSIIKKHCFFNNDQGSAILTACMGFIAFCSMCTVVRLYTDLSNV